MEEEYWERFFHSGSVNDYLEYKAMELCSRTISKYDGGAAEGTDVRYTNTLGGIDDMEKIINDAGGAWKCQSEYKSGCQSGENQY